MDITINVPEVSPCLRRILMKELERLTSNLLGRKCTPDLEHKLNLEAERLAHSLAHSARYRDGYPALTHILGLLNVLKV